MPTASTAAPARCDGCAGAGLAARGPVVLRPQEASRRPPRGGSDPVRPGLHLRDLRGPWDALAAPAL